MLGSESFNLLQDMSKIEISMFDSADKVRNPRKTIAPITNHSIILTKIYKSRVEKLKSKPAQPEELQTSYKRNIHKLLPKNSKCFTTLSEIDSGIQGIVIPCNISIDPYGNRPFKNV
jgi:hypothetical protein